MKIEKFAVDVQTSPYNWTRYAVADNKKEAEKIRRKAKNETGYTTTVYCFETNTEEAKEK